MVVTADRDDGGGSVGIGCPVIGLVSEVIAPGVVVRRGVAEGTIAVQRKSAVAHRRHQRSCQRVRIHIAVIGKYAGGDYYQGSIPECGVAVIGRRRRAVDRRDGI